ncbi:MAG TPA: hypothetical protein VK395_30870 [Gemmataceae bacterium]|nr:hypothetical protein [Gemmataceae bacterium]
MSRETKAGIVVSCSFLCLVGIVLFGKMGQSDGQSSASQEQPGDVPPEAPAEPRLAANQEHGGRTENQSQSGSGKSSANDIQLARGAGAPGPFPLGDPASKSGEGTDSKEPIPAKPSPRSQTSTGPAAPDEHQLIMEPEHDKAAAPGASPPVPPPLSSPWKLPAGEGGLADKNGPKSAPSGGLKTDKNDTPNLTGNNSPAGKNGAPRSGTSEVKNETNQVAPKPDTTPISIDMPGLTGKQKDMADNLKNKDSGGLAGKPVDPSKTSIELPPLPVLRSETPPTSKGNEAPAARMGLNENKTGLNAPAAPPVPNSLATSSGHSGATNVKEGAPVLPAPAIPGNGAPNFGAGTRQGTSPSTQGSAAPAPTLDLNTGTAPSPAMPSPKPLGADQGSAGLPHDSPALPPLGAPHPSDNSRASGAQLSPPTQSAQVPLTSSPNSAPTRTLAPLGASAGAVSAPIVVPAQSVIPQATANNEPQVESYDEETYAWKQNDSFRAISQQYYQTDKYERALVLFNRNHPLAKDGVRLEPPQLQPGQEVYIPPTRILEKYYAVGINSSTSAPQNAVAVPHVSVPITPTPVVATPVSTSNQELKYRVQPSGEMLFDIARRTLGNPERWTDIYRLNKQYNPQDPIPGGSELVMPSDARLDTPAAP